MKMLYPNCSTIVWRLNIPKEKDIRKKILDKFDGIEEENSETTTDSYPNGCLNEMIILLEEAGIDKSNIENIEVEILENSGGGGDEYFVVDCLKIAKKYIKGEITKKQAEKFEDRIWNNDEEDIDEILSPNCSEMVFKLYGNLENIKEEVLKMLDVVEKEDGKRKEISKLRKRIENISDLKEFEDIVFEFTCNYETYFKEKNGELLVATCNNHEWEGSIDYEFIGGEGSEEYHKIANYNYYELLFKEGKYSIAKESYGDKLVIFEGDIKMEYGNTFKLIKKKGKLYIAKNNELVKVKEIKDEKLKNKLMILAKL